MWGEKSWDRRVREYKKIVTNQENSSKKKGVGQKHGGGPWTEGGSVDVHSKTTFIQQEGLESKRRSGSLSALKKSPVWVLVAKKGGALVEITNNPL